MAQLQFIDALESDKEWVCACNIQLVFLYTINMYFNRKILWYEDEVMAVNGFFGS